MDKNLETIISSLPKEKGWCFESIYKYKGFWFEKPFLFGAMVVQKYFNPKPNDLILATLPKAGTTWFCALLFATIHRTRYDFETHPLLTQNPHDCVPQLEFQPLKNRSNPTIPKFFTSPIIATHIPYALLPKCVNNNVNCKIVYVCRDPMDLFVSSLHFANNLRPKELPPLGVDEAFEVFCNGSVPFGSYWDNVLEYWNANLEMPNKVCFVRYEDMKKQPLLVLKKLALFLGCPFSVEEEDIGVPQKIVDLCSFKSLANLEVNSASTHREEVPGMNFQNNSYFRKGQIGDHKNYLTVEMIERLKDIINIKFAGSGLEVFAT